MSFATSHLNKVISEINPRSKAEAYFCVVLSD